MAALKQLSMKVEEQIQSGSDVRYISGHEINMLVDILCFHIEDSIRELVMISGEEGHEFDPKEKIMKSYNNAVTRLSEERSKRDNSANARPTKSELVE